MAELDNFQNVTIRCCSYCGNPGHNVRRCTDAYYDGMQIHNQILNVIGEHLVVPQLMDNAVKMFIQSLTLTKLKILSYIHTDLHLFAEQLYTNFQIPLSFRSLTSKRGLIVILGLYYENIYTTYLNSLNRPRPIYVRSFNIELQMNHQTNAIVSPFLCPICLDDINITQCIVLNCKHDVCVDCFNKYLSSLNIDKEPCCSLCRIQTTVVTFQDQDSYDIIKNKHFVN